MRSVTAVSRVWVCSSRSTWTRSSPDRPHRWLRAGGAPPGAWAWLALGLGLASLDRMAHDPRALPDEVLAFLTERHLATLTTLRADGTPHVVAVGFTWDPDAGLARVITNRTSRKVAHVRAGSPRAVVAQVDGPRWLSMEGIPTVSDDPDRIAEAVRWYAGRYRQPAVNAERVVIEITVDRVLGRG